MYSDVAHSLDSFLGRPNHCRVDTQRLQEDRRRIHLDYPSFQVRPGSLQETAHRVPVGRLDEVRYVIPSPARGLEKIKTIGDAYMVASGVPTARDDHAQALCDLALDMRDHVQERTYAGQRIECRIGINSGPVVAGIIGTKKFSYDLWGDAVNTASRMESSGQPGRVQITEATMRSVADDFVCESGGVIDVKGKGPMPVWFLEGRKPRGR